MRRSFAKIVQVAVTPISTRRQVDIVAKPRAECLLDLHANAQADDTVVVSGRSPVHRQANAGVLRNMQCHVRQAQRVGEVLCALGLVGAKRDHDRPVGASRLISCSALPSACSTYIVKRNRTFGERFFRREERHLKSRLWTC